MAKGAWGKGGGGPGNPQDLNRYSYALNNPVRHTDPTGHCNNENYGSIPKCSGQTYFRVYQPLEPPGPPDPPNPPKGGLGNGNSSGRNVPIPAVPSPSEAAARQSAIRPASAPVGRRGSPIEVTGNEPTLIEGRPYSGHALDRMQGRGVPPAAVENTIAHGAATAGRTPNTTVHGDSSNGVTVVTNTNTGRVITVITTRIR